MPNSHIAEVAKAGDGQPCIHSSPHHPPSIVILSLPLWLDCDSGTLTIKCEEGHVHQGYDVVLAAIGRVPATKSLGLSK